jgi:hypothetical protein
MILFRVFPKAGNTIMPGTRDMSLSPSDKPLSPRQRRRTE